MKPRYSIEFIDSFYPIRIIDHYRGTTKQYCPSNFIHGAGDYIENTRDYPNYIHKAIWEAY